MGGVRYWIAGNLTLLSRIANQSNNLLPGITVSPRHYGNFNKLQFEASDHALFIITLIQVEWIYIKNASGLTLAFVTLITIMNYQPFVLVGQTSRMLL